ncbi:MAG: hypothetical protein IT350_09635 [Deltaproteobacteria bacterium]|nr:hypothetical protein [Deltaproteobacteria bacterium]
MTLKIFNRNRSYDISNGNALASTYNKFDIDFINNGLSASSSPADVNRFINGTSMTFALKGLRQPNKISLGDIVHFLSLSNYCEYYFKSIRSSFGMSASDAEVFLLNEISTLESRGLPPKIESIHVDTSSFIRGGRPFFFATTDNHVKATIATYPSDCSTQIVRGCGLTPSNFDGQRLVSITIKNNLLNAVRLRAPTTLDAGCNLFFAPSVQGHPDDGMGRARNLINLAKDAPEVVVEQISITKAIDDIYVLKEVSPIASTPTESDMMGITL